MKRSVHTKDNYNDMVLKIVVNIKQDVQYMHTLQQKQYRFTFFKT